MLKLITLAFLILTGCAATPEKNVISMGSKSVTSLDNVATDDLRLAEVGDMVGVDGVQYTVVEKYRAASGRDCKKLLTNKLLTLRIACETETGLWYLRKSLTSQNATIKNLADTTAPALDITPAPESVDLVASDPVVDEIDLNEVQLADVTTEDPSVVEARSFPLLPTENLWRFSKRLTGNANNWQKIAHYNQVENVAALRAGDRLAIPTHMSVRSDGG